MVTVLQQPFQLPHQIGLVASCIIAVVLRSRYFVDAVIDIFMECPLTIGACMSGREKMTSVCIANYGYTYCIQAFFVQCYSRMLNKKADFASKY